MHQARTLEVTDPRAAALTWERIDREVVDRRTSRFCGLVTVLYS